jgi:predicted DNA-binding protein
MQNETYRDYVSVRFLPGERERLERLAKATDRTISEVIRWLVRKAEVQPGNDIRLVTTEESGHECKE